MRIPNLPAPSARVLGQWGALIAGSAALTWLLGTAHLPAALLLGTMIAAIACGIAGFRIRVPRPAFQGAQALVGVLIGHAMTGSVARTIAERGPLMILVVLVTVAASAFVGWALTRLRILPGATAAWGSSPGAASAMIAMAEVYGADPRFVAFMQYVRVVCVALVATLAGHIWSHPAAATALPATPEPGGFGPLLATLAAAGAGIWLGRTLRLPSGALIGPALIVAGATASGFTAFALPGWLLALAYAGIGWTVGLRFTRATLRAALRALPALLVASLGLIGLCGGWAYLLTRLIVIDPLTAYLATSPGGIDTVAIIALGTGADVPFVMATQVLRMIVVLLTGPIIARAIMRGAPDGPGAQR